MNNNNNKKGIKWLIYLIFGGFLVKLFRFIFKGDNEKKIAKNFKNFFKKEGKEVCELISGQESFKKYCNDSGQIFKSYFLPSDCNGYKPKILRTKSLTIIAIALLFVKISVSGYLFFIYPNFAKMSAVLQSEVCDLMNLERQTNGVDDLAINTKLNTVAQAKAQDMIDNNYFAHKTLDGKMIWDMIDRNDYPYIFVGENLAMNFTSAQSAHKALMQSPTHKKNILNSKYTEVGIAVVSGEINNKKTNILVQVFAQAKDVQSVVVKASTESVAPSAVKAEETNPVQPTIKEEIKTKSIPEQIIKPIKEESKVLAVETKDEDKIIAAPIETKPSSQKNVAKPQSEIIPVPNQAEQANIPASVKQISIEVEKSSVSNIINYSQYIFIGVLIFLMILLILNILVRASIQHKPVIVQTLLLMVFVYGLMNVKLHFLENLSENIFIL